MDVSAAGNRLHRFAHGAAIFYHVLLQRQVAHRDFVAQRYIGNQFHFSGSFAFEGDSADSSAFFQIHDGNADIILRFVQ